RFEDAAFDAGVDTETRHSLGARFFGSAGPFDWNVEPIVQVGSFGDRDIAAWTIGTDWGARLGQGRLAPRLGLRANVISGGSSDDTLRTFNALFPNNSYFSEAALFAPANLIDVNPTLQIPVTEAIGFELLWDFLWRYDDGDAVYAPPGTPLLPSDSLASRYIGNTISINGRWQTTPRTAIATSYVHFEPSDSVRDAGGRSVDYVAVWFELAF
ncbi:MAG: alginate export family protein, partial [Planctomycetota bacterium]